MSKKTAFKNEDTTTFPFEYCIPDRTTLAATRRAIKLSNERKGWFLVLNLRKLSPTREYVIDATFNAEFLKRVTRVKSHWADYLDGFIECYEAFKNGEIK